MIWIYESISQYELAKLYRGATALVFASLRETFGLPIVEAMACGCPVVTSNSTGCVEVAGTASITVDPRNIEDISKAMFQVAIDPILYGQLRSEGLKRAAKFSWKYSAAALVRLFFSINSPERNTCFPIRKLEITTVTDCSINCLYCPQGIFKNSMGKNAESKLSWDTFVTCISKLPPFIYISFGGMSEPFLNPQCFDMIEYVKKRGHTVEIFTTLVGCNPDQIDCLLNILNLGDDQSYDRLFIHIPSAGNVQKMMLMILTYS